MQCPVCRAGNDQGPQCRRCKVDLSLLFLLEQQRKQALVRALECGRNGEWSRALALAGWAETLQSDERSRRLLAVCRLMCRDFAGAWETCLRITAEA